MILQQCFLREWSYKSVLWESFYNNLVFQFENDPIRVFTLRMILQQFFFWQWSYNSRFENDFIRVFSLRIMLQVVLSENDTTTVFIILFTLGMTLQVFSEKDLTTVFQCLSEWSNNDPLLGMILHHFSLRMILRQSSLWQWSYGSLLFENDPTTVFSLRMILRQSSLSQWSYGSLLFDNDPATAFSLRMILRQSSLWEWSYDTLLFDIDSTTVFFLRMILQVFSLRRESLWRTGGLVQQHVSLISKKSWNLYKALVWNAVAGSFRICSPSWNLFLKSMKLTKYTITCSL